jgi:2-succinyl-5-enolpyruvyl-6-hydroxy-3-cyclohexene-1-carboxylate synthase
LLKIYTGVDERSACFAALGLSLGARRPVVVVCTSGTALLNLGPAVAEAYYLRLPLVILSADRPYGSEGHQRGQVIRQDGALDHHLRGSYRWMPDDKAWDLERSEKLFELALNTAILQSGPVHLNVPLHEPLYENRLPTEASKVPTHLNSGGLSIKVETQESSIPPELQSELQNSISNGRKIWFLAGMNRPDENLKAILQKCQDLGVIQIWSEDLANIHTGIPIRDDWFKASPPEWPDLIISWGGPLVSKYFKLFLQNNPHYKHWRIDSRGDRIDTYNRLDGVWKCQLEIAIPILCNILQNSIKVSTNKSLSKSVSTQKVDQWKGTTKETGKDNENDKDKENGDLSALKSVTTFDQIIRKRFSKLIFSDSLALSVILPFLKDSRVHLGNSSLVRKFLALPWDKSLIKSIHCNRGTSGIEGNVSTAVGEAWAHPEDSVWILNGDLSTAYDAGAWLLEPRPSVKIVVFNNAGGDIFRQILGSSVQPECEELFVTPRNIQWSSWCRGYGIPHKSAIDLHSLGEGLHWLSNLDGTGFLEIITQPSSNRQAELALGEEFDLSF